MSSVSAVSTSLRTWPSPRSRVVRSAADALVFRQVCRHSAVFPGTCADRGREAAAQRSSPSCMRHVSFAASIAAHFLSNYSTSEIYFTIGVKPTFRNSRDGADTQHRPRRVSPRRCASRHDIRASRSIGAGPFHLTPGPLLMSISLIKE